MTASLRQPIVFGWCLVAALIAASAPSFAETTQADDQANVRVARFDIDATPPVGFMMAYDPVRRVEELGLRCRGIVIEGAGDPIVLCAVDWIGIGNESQTAFKRTLARAAKTTPDRVAVHTLHQHDAPRCDFSAEAILHDAGVVDLGPHAGQFARSVLQRLELSVSEAIQDTSRVTHAGIGVAEVTQVASNRRLLGDDGKVRAVRYTTTRDPLLRAEPEGVIDRELSCLSLWDQERPVAILTYYACHPQSYYRTGIPSPDFPGIARFIRGQELPNVLHLHFNGAGGNIGAGKYNDGAKENRMILASRVADAMRRAFESTKKFPLTASQVDWATEDVLLPVAEHLDESELVAALKDWHPKKYWGSPDKLAWLRRCQSDDPITVSCLTIGSARVLHMPGELFVEYQLAAKAMRTDLDVAMAAYGDYGPGYIGTRIAYEQGGYETSKPASNVSPDVEDVLMAAMSRLLGSGP